MRRLPPRPPLPPKTQQKLDDETAAIEGSEDPKQAAVDRYARARKSKWFNPVAAQLRWMSGPGERCMWCSGSEASNVDHLCPKTVFPNLALTWTNLLWSCGICNNRKGNQFPAADQGGPLLDPTKDDAWDHFFIDEFGNLAARWNTELADLDPRALATMRVLTLDREALQQTRQHRLIDLRRKVTDSLKLHSKGELSASDLQGRLGEWLAQPFQPDVADYFLRGPGNTEEPFNKFFNVLDSE
jgi:uncharacterized protein (TIGR02646 family)